MEIPCGACTRQEEIAWIGKGCTAWFRAAVSPGYPSPTSVSTALPLPPSPGYLQGLQQRDYLDFPAFPRLETLSLERLLFAHQTCCQSSHTTSQLTLIYPNLSINLLSLLPCSALKLIHVGVPWTLKY